MTNIQIQIGDVGNVLMLLGHVYKEPRDALAEFVTNGWDAEAKKIVIDLHRRGKYPFICISDDGKGMDDKELRRVAESIGDSIKKFAERMQVGEKGIGILGFVNLGTMMTMVSRRHQKTYQLTAKAGSRDAEMSEAKYPRSRRGTDVYIEGIYADKSRILTSQRLIEYFKDKFRQPLQQNQFKLIIKEGNKQYTVRPDEYKGEPFTVKSKDTSFGPVQFSLYIVPTDWSRPAKVYIYRKGVLVVENISEMPEFSNEPWMTNRVQGEINCNFVDITSGRDAIVRDPIKFPVFIDTIRSIEQQLTDVIKQKTDEYEQQKSEEINRILRKIFEKALSDIEDIEPLRVRITSNEGDVIEGNVLEQDGVLKIGEESFEKREPTQLVKESPHDKIKSVFGKGLRWVLEPFYDQPSLRSKYEAELGIIKINTIHKDYQKEVASIENKIRYYAVLTIKELILYNYREADPITLLEKMIDLQLRVYRYLNKA